MSEPVWMKWGRWGWIIVLSCGLGWGMYAGVAAAPGTPEPPTAQPLAPQARYESHFEVLYVPEGASDAGGNPCFTWDPAAQAAVTYALDFWANLLVTPTTRISIQACWANLATGHFLVQPAWVERLGAPAPGLNSWYPAALANTLPGPIWTETQLHLTYNRNAPWYYGVSTTELPADQYDFISAVMRQVAQGIGFKGNMRVSNQRGYWQYYGNNPIVYDRFIQNGAGQVLITEFAEGSMELAQQLQSNNLYFNGYSAGVANGGPLPKLYAPAVWEPDASVIYLDAGYADTAEGLMTPPLPGKAYRDVGPVILGILRDTGWYFTRNTPPTLGGLPDQVLPMNGELKPMLDLWEYAADPESADDALLSFAVISGVPQKPTVVSIQNTHYLSISLQNSGWSGDADITIQVIDTDGATDTDVFRVTGLNTNPTIANVPDTLAPMNIPYTQVLDFRRYASDAEDSKKLLSFAVACPSPHVTITVSQNRFLDIYPGPDYLGMVPVTVTVTDSGEETGQDYFNVTVTDENIPPTLQISNKSVYLYGERTIDLKTLDWDGANDYARDPEGQPLTITLQNAPAAYAGVSTDGVRYIHIEPTGNGVGTTLVQVRAQDPEGAYTDDSFNVRIWDYARVRLPIVMRNFSTSEE